MSDALDKAEAAARDAAANTDVVRIVAAVLAAQQAMQGQAPAPACQHEHRRGRSTGEWLAIGCAVCVGSVGLALGFLAIAISGISVAILALVLRSMWRDFQKGR